MTMIAMRGMECDSSEALLDSWKQGRTGYPLVDAGMRQLAGEGWMHNRVRMVTASFLTKDLHLMSPEEQSACGCRIGVVDHAEERLAALAMYAAAKGAKRQQ